MQRLIGTLAVVGLAAAGFFVAGSFAQSRDNGSPSTGQVTICHHTGDPKRPFIVISPDASGVYDGHAGLSHQYGDDIIPAFSYVDAHGETVSFPGQNLGTNYDGTSGATLLAQGCSQTGGTTSTIVTTSTNGTTSIQATTSTMGSTQTLTTVQGTTSTTGSTQTVTTVAGTNPAGGATTTAGVAGSSVPAATTTVTTAATTTAATTTAPFTPPTTPADTTPATAQKPGGTFKPPAQKSAVATRRHSASPHLAFTP
jgi:hypothetical protein